MKIGFTGTQRGMTDEQKQTLRGYLRNQVMVRPEEFHHGDCIGADQQAAIIAYTLGIKLVIHPPIKEDKRAYVLLSQSEVRLARAYLDRNHDIVDETEILFAAPKTAEEQQRSGTWATVRYAEKKHKRIYLIYPGGSALYFDGGQWRST
jgi:hypothetical protein